MTIKSRLTCTLVTVVFFAALLGAGSLLVQDRLAAGVSNLEKQSKKIALVADLQLATQKLLMPANDYIITGKSSYAKDFASLGKEAEDIFRAIEQSGYFDKKELALIGEAHALFASVQDAGKEIFARPAGDRMQPELMETMDYKYAEPMIKGLRTVNDEIRLTFATTQLETAELRRVSRIGIMTAIVVLTIILVTAGSIQFKNISRSLNALNGGLREIADGKGDLTRRISFDQRDELGMLSHWFNKFTEQLQGMMGEVHAASSQVSRSAQDISRTSGNVHEFATVQFNAIANTSQATERLNESIQGIAVDAEKLLILSTDASASSREISTSMGNVAALTEELDVVADTTLTAVNQLNRSFKEVSGSVLALTDKANHVVASAVEINAVARNISAYAHDQAQRAAEIKAEAFSIGMETVKKTKERMEKIRLEVSATAGVMEQLGELTAEIGRIVGMIVEITNQTKMLALNASILAAQSGTDGKGFSVVAEEVKALAVKTTFSTKEIASMIQQVQDQATAAIEAARRSTQEAEEGVKLSFEAETVLGTIIGKTEISLHNAMKVARAAEEQTTGLGQVTDSIQLIQQMIATINQAIVEQKKASDNILAASEGVHSFTREARGAIAAQSEESQQIAVLFDEVNHRVGMIVQSTLEQQKSSTEIVTALEMVSLKAQENIKLAGALDEIVGDLDGQARLLLAKIDRFTI